MSGSGAAVRLAGAWAMDTAGTKPEVTDAITAKTAPRADREKVMYDSVALISEWLPAWWQQEKLSTSFQTGHKAAGPASGPPRRAAPSAASPVPWSEPGHPAR